uniref:Haloacid dehalogenase-like hydrolase domain-containing 5 n=1 Tax=Leptobrachium leishanense TaxID=445787 RepID=A0A8C5QWU5_9ANUR
MKGYSFLRALRALRSRIDPRAGLCQGEPPGVSNQPSFGLLFDIDGVLVRGKTPIPAARKAFKKLVDDKGQFLLPVVFVTNAGNCLRQTKATQLTNLLGVPITQEQVMMSHSPLRIFKQYHQKHVLVSGQGPILDIAKYLGFTNAITVDSVRERFPFLDMVDHTRRPKILPSSAEDLPKIDAVILFGEPIRWETNLQIIIDVLMTGGYPANAHQSATRPHIPLLACNMDLMWMSEARSPRFGHGIFMLCLENIYKKITGDDLKYEVLMGKPSEITYQYAEFLIRLQTAAMQWRKPVQTLYAIGDNLMTDIYGANLYNRQLQQTSSRNSSETFVQAASGAGIATVSQEEDPALENKLSFPAATRCHSILVCTGISNPRAEVPADTSKSVTETVFHGHRDFKFEPSLVEPGYIVDDVDAAVDLIFKLEDFFTAH